jgi:hypothetical protein
LKKAEAKTAGGPEVYRKRVAFVRGGFTFTRMMIGELALLKRIDDTKGADREALARAAEGWKQLQQFEAGLEPVAVQIRGTARLLQQTSLGRYCTFLRKGQTTEKKDSAGPPPEQ